MLEFYSGLQHEYAASYGIIAPAISYGCTQAPSALPNLCDKIAAPKKGLVA